MHLVIPTQNSVVLTQEQAYVPETNEERLAREQALGEILWGRAEQERLNNMTQEERDDLIDRRSSPEHLRARFAVLHERESKRLNELIGITAQERVVTQADTVIIEKFRVILLNNEKYLIDYLSHQFNTDSKLRTLKLMKDVVVSEYEIMFERNLLEPDYLIVKRLWSGGLIWEHYTKETEKIIKTVLATPDSGPVPMIID